MSKSRMPVKASKDKAIFKRTYAKSKRVNRQAGSQQGGIRF